ncbi:hypothetical protein FRC03_011215 [Tulasnella sp. 419]|nr:hypothetical protein FRC03_011215 [Tulasnella sp. 419]
MRYLMKLTPQIRALISKEYADTIVWRKHGDEDRDYYDDEDGEDYDDDSYDTSSDEEEATNNPFRTQEECAQIYHNFEFIHPGITSKQITFIGDLPQDTPSRLDCKLVVGERFQALLEPTLIHYKRDKRQIDGWFDEHSLNAELMRHKSIILGKQLTKEGIRILLDQGGLERRAADLVGEWKQDTKRIKWKCEEEMRAISNGMNQIQLHFGRVNHDLRVRLSRGNSGCISLP